MKYPVKIVKQVVGKISGNKLSQLPTVHRFYNSPDMFLPRIQRTTYSTPPN